MSYGVKPDPQERRWKRRVNCQFYWKPEAYYVYSSGPSASRHPLWAIHTRTAGWNQADDQSDHARPLRLFPLFFPHHFEESPHGGIVGEESGVPASDASVPGTPGQRPDQQFSDPVMLPIICHCDRNLREFGVGRVPYATRHRDELKFPSLRTGCHHNQGQTIHSIAMRKVVRLFSREAAS